MYAIWIIYKLYLNNFVNVVYINQFNILFYFNIIIYLNKIIISIKFIYTSIHIFHSYDILIQKIHKIIVKINFIFLKKKSKFINQVPKKLTIY